MSLPFFGTFYLKILNIQIQQKNRDFPIAKITPPRVKIKKNNFKENGKTVKCYFYQAFGL